ncbi:MAG: diacylglycerol/lipid kinase family protein [Senegalia sp. (in: firmicutes)]|uniref:diacylglycerol/lipid kinase family protein n=1 Tax=Senegalia sp. (in: firmicutes) TaxID=1924098 RepID=UPI003F946083
MKIAFIINPIAGKNRKKDIKPIIEMHISNSHYEYIIVYTDGIDDARILTKNFLDENYEIIVGVGGDGTIREVASGIKEKGKGILGIIPMGTGNDLARSLNVSLNINEALKRIIRGKTKEVNIGLAEENIFLNVASIGLDAEIVKNTKLFKGIFKGKVAYTMGILRTLLIFKSKEVTIEYNNIKRDEKILLIALANGKYYGGGIKITPQAKIDDNKLDICIIKEIPKFKLLFLFPSVYNGNHGKYKKYVEFIRVDSFNIDTKDEVFLNIDGDILSKKGLIKFNLYEKNINIII